MMNHFRGGSPRGSFHDGPVSAEDATQCHMDSGLNFRPWMNTPFLTAINREVREYSAPSSLQKELYRLQYELKEANKQIESLQWELKESMAIREDYRKSLSSESERWKNLVDHVGAYREDSMINRRNQLCAEEKLRRQTEMLEECQGKLDISLQMNNALVVKQAELQRWTNHLDDDEARYTMNQLCQDTETWVKRHFPEVLPRGRPDDFNTYDPSARSNGDFRLFCAIYDYIACSIFKKYLTRTMVGYIDPRANEDLSIIEKQIHLICPAHVTQHWRSAMSTATFSMSREDLISDCGAHVASMNDTLYRPPSADAKRQNEQLENLVWKFVNFKSKLDAQADRYLFLWAWPHTPFCEQTMTSFMGESDVDAVVLYCFAPAFFKVMSDNEKVLVRKAVVVTGVRGTDDE